MFKVLPRNFDFDIRNCEKLILYRKFTLVGQILKRTEITSVHNERQNQIKNKNKKNKSLT